MNRPFVRRRGLWSLIALICVLTVGVLPAGAITGGGADGNGHPNVGAILLPGPQNQGSIVCTGTLISTEVFLTAGHCTHFLEGIVEAGYIAVGDVRVSFNPTNAPGDYAGAVSVSEIITHPDYVPNPGGMGIGVPDIGVLILAAPVTGITPAALPSLGYLDVLRDQGKLRQKGQAGKFTTVGYGTTLEWPPPIIVNPDGMRRVAQSEFLNLRKTWLNMSQNLAPGNQNGGTGYGDSGGPTFWKEENGREVLVAICSWGDMMTVATGTAWRADIPTSLDFLKDVFAKLSE
jgi:hypothetical protein